MEALLFASFEPLLCTLAGSPFDTMSDPSTALAEVSSKLAGDTKAQLWHPVYTWILTDAGNLRLWDD